MAFTVTARVMDNDPHFSESYDDLEEAMKRAKALITQSNKQRDGGPPYRKTPPEGDELIRWERSLYVMAIVTE